MSDHPDFEALSAWLDGEDAGADPGVRAALAADHVATCAVCQAQVAKLRMVRESVGAPVRPPAAGVIDAAVARAVAAADEWAAAPVGPAAPAEPAAWPPLRHRERRRPVPWRLWLTGSAAAAAVVIVVLTALLVSGGSESRDDTALSAGPGTPTAESAREAAPPGAGAGALAPVAPENLTVQELGDVNDVGTLRARVPVGLVGTEATASRAADSAAPRVVGTRVCEIEARTARPTLGLVTYVANLRYQGTPAVALGFAPASGASTPVTLLVLAPGDGCRVLTETTIP